MFPVYETATIAPSTYTIVHFFLFRLSAVFTFHNYLQMYLSINICIYFCCTILHKSSVCLTALFTSMHKYAEG